ANGFSTTVRVERDGTASKNLVCQTMLWRCEWLGGGKEHPEELKLAALTVEEFEEAARSGDALFSDEAERVLGGSQAWRAQLVPSQPDWLRHMDTGVT